MCFKHYNAEEVGGGAFTVVSCTCTCMPRRARFDRKQICGAQVLMGKKMEDWLRFSVCYWHSFCATGTGGALGRFALLFFFFTMHFTWAFHREALLWGHLLHSGADPFGFPTLHRPWNEGAPVDAAKRRLQAAFEFFTKLGVRDICFPPSRLGG